jgi:hypothetical protein
VVSLRWALWDGRRAATFWSGRPEILVDIWSKERLLPLTGCGQARERLMTERASALSGSLGRTAVYLWTRCFLERTQLVIYPRI